jgi:hypothetical protein
MSKLINNWFNRMFNVRKVDAMFLVKRIKKEI